MHDVPSFKDWASVEPEREKLVGMWRDLVEAEHLRPSTGGLNAASGSMDLKGRVGEGRLVELLRQAGAWQVQQCSRRGRGPWRVAS